MHPSLLRNLNILAAAVCGSLFIAACAALKPQGPGPRYVYRGVSVETGIDSSVVDSMIDAYGLQQKSGEATVTRMHSEKNNEYRINIINPPAANARIGACRWLTLQTTEAGLYVKEKGPCWDQY